MTARRMLRAAAVVAATIAASVVLVGATATPAPIPDDNADPVRASQYWLDAAHIREAWQTTRGAGATIAVIDTGIAKVPGIFDGAVADGDDEFGPGADQACLVGVVHAADGAFDEGDVHAFGVPLGVDDGGADDVDLGGELEEPLVEVEEGHVAAGAAVEPDGGHAGFGGGVGHEFTSRIWAR